MTLMIILHRLHCVILFPEKVCITVEVSSLIRTADRRTGKQRGTIIPFKYPFVMIEDAAEVYRAVYNEFKLDKTTDKSTLPVYNVNNAPEVCTSVCMGYMNFYLQFL